MTEPQDDREQAEGEYPLAPLEPESPRPDPPPLPGHWIDPEDIEPRAPEEFQFSLSELLLLTAAVSVVCSLTVSALKLVPQEMQAKGFAGILGFGALVCMVICAVPHPRKIVVVGWWVVVALYAIACVVAAFTSQ